MATSPSKVTRVFQQYVLRYDLDIQNKQILIRVKILIKDGLRTYFNPAISLLTPRLVDERPIKVPSRENLDLRQLRLCFSNFDNVTLETNLVIPNPYSPDKGEWKGFIRQVIEETTAIKVDYKGETKNRQYSTVVSPLP